MPTLLAIKAWAQAWWKGFWTDGNVFHTRSELHWLIIFLQARGYTGTAQKLIEACEMVAVEHVDPDRQSRAEAYRGNNTKVTT